MSALKSTTDSAFEEDVLNAGMPVLVDFWAEWCAPCRTMNPLLEQLAQDQAESLQIVKLDVQENPDVALQYGVMNIPALILFVDGKVKAKLNGFMPLAKIVDKIAPHLPK